MQLSASGLRIHIIDDAQAGFKVLRSTVALLMLHPCACNSISTYAYEEVLVDLSFACWHAVHAMLCSV